MKGDMMNCRLLALPETRSALPPPSPFFPPLSWFLLHCSPVHPSSLFSFYASFSLPSFLLYNFSESSRASPAIASSLFLPLSFFYTLLLSLYCPHNFHLCPPSFIQVYLTHFCCVTCVSIILSLLLSPFMPSICQFAY